MSKAIIEQASYFAKLVFEQIIPALKKPKTQQFISEDTSVNAKLTRILDQLSLSDKIYLQAYEYVSSLNNIPVKEFAEEFVW